jgi:hypothetical protein
MLGGEMRLSVIFFVIAIFTFLVSCSSAPKQETMTMETALVKAGTQVAIQEFAKETIMSQVSLTQTAEVTPIPIVTPTNLLSREEQIAKTNIDIGKMLELIPGVATVNLVRSENGLLDIELQSSFASKDYQPQLSYETIKLISVMCGGITEEKMNNFTDGSRTIIRIVTLSSMGDYRYVSETDFPTCVRISKKQISYDEWKELAKADFR